MGTFKGKRIIPKHDGVWNQKKEYEELTIVLDAESGDGYISRKPVPAGTVLSDTDYWSLCSHFNAQMHRLETDVAEDVEGMHRDLSETKASMSEEVSEAESRVNTKVSDAQNAMQKTEDAMNTAVEQMNKRLDANVTASTDSKADYAAELVDVRVGMASLSIPSGYVQMPFLFLCPAKRSCGNKFIFFFHCFCLWLEDRLELTSQPTDPFHNRNCLLHFLLCSQRLLDQGSNSGISVFLGFG